MSVKKLHIDKDNSNRRIDNYLMSIYKDLPKSKIYSMIRKGEIRVNSGRIKPMYKLNENDLIRIPPYLNDTKPVIKKISNDLKNTFKKLIIHDDNNYIVINKPSGIAVHAGSKNNIGLIDIFRSLYNFKIDLCHRLDKETSGCIVMAKNKKALKFFNNNLANRSKDLKKTYVAILKGNIKKNIYIDLSIDTNKDSLNKRVNINNSGKRSKSLFKPIKALKGSTLVEIDIFTGRTHQIRVQAESLGHNVLNDNRYGDKEFNMSIGKSVNKILALHSKIIEFQDESNNIIKVEAPIPESFTDLVDYLN